MGVTALFPHTPSRSGFPSGVRGTFHAFAPGEVPAEPGDWAATESAADPTATRTVSRCFTSASIAKSAVRERGSAALEGQVIIVDNRSASMIAVLLRAAQAPHLRHRGVGGLALRQGAVC